MLPRRPVPCSRLAQPAASASARVHHGLLLKELKHGGHPITCLGKILKINKSTFKPYLARTGLRDPSRKFRRIFSMVKLGITFLWLITGSSYGHFCVFDAISYHFLLILNIHSKNKCNRMGWRTIKCNRMGGVRLEYPIRLHLLTLGDILVSLWCHSDLILELCLG